MRRALVVCAVVCTALLAACAEPQLQIPKEVKVAVPVACIDAKDKPVRPPLMPDGELLALDTYRRTLALWSEWLKLRLYVGELEPVVETCSRIPPPPAAGRPDTRP